MLVWKKLRKGERLDTEELWRDSRKTTEHAYWNCHHSSTLLFLNPIFMSVTLFPRYFGVPSYWSLNLFTYSQQNTGKHYKQIRMMDATYQLTNKIRWVNMQ